MSHRTRFALVAAALAGGLTASARADTVAITEFLINPWGTDLREYEWIELYNHGAQAIDLTGWTLKDNATTVFTFDGVTIDSGGYLIAAASKSLFETRWLGGASDDRVIDGVPFQMNNGSGDGLYLRNAQGDLMWSLGYGPGHEAYRATWLTGDDFSTIDYGVPPQDGFAYVNHNGNDGNPMFGIDLGPGYEGNGFTTDPYAYASAAGSEEDPTPEWGSPLAGQYTAVPEPASLALLAVGGLLMVQRRKSARA